MTACCGPRRLACRPTRPKTDLQRGALQEQDIVSPDDGTQLEAIRTAAASLLPF